MANRLKMATVQSIRSLHQKGWSQQRIAQALGVDRGTVSRYLRRAAEPAQRDSSPSHPRAGPADSKPAIAPTGSGSKPAIAPTGSESPEDGQRAGPAATASAAREGAAEPGHASVELPVATGEPSAGRRSDCEPWREAILAKSQQGLSAKRIHQDLVGDRRASAARAGPFQHAPYRG